MNVLRVGAPSAGGTDAKSSVYPAFSVTGNSDEFDDNSFSGWTAVQTTPALTLTETNNALSIYHPGGDSAGVFHAWVKAQSFVANDWVEIAVRGLGTNQNFNIIGLIFADGNTFNAGNQVAGLPAGTRDAGYGRGSHRREQPQQRPGESSELVPCLPLAQDSTGPERMGRALDG